MPPKAAKQPQEASTKKTKKQKRKAVSPLNDVAGTTTVGGEPNIPSDRKVKTKYDIEQPPVVPIVTRSDSISYMNLNMNNTGTMSGSTPMPGQGAMYMYPSPAPSSSQSYGQVMGAAMGPPPIPPQQLSFHTSPSPRPDWVNEISEDIKTIKVGMNKIDKTLNIISMKVNNLEEKLTQIDTRVTDVENSCSFVNEKYDTQKAEIQSTKANIKAVQDQCKQLEDRQKEMKAQTESINKIDSKILDLESRSMRENLMFFGVDEEDGDDDNAEDCFDKIKAFLKEILDFGEGEARDIELDRAHRMGRKRDTTIRPIVVKFHRYSDREKVRIRGYEKRDILKTKKLSVRAQWPKEIMDKRKPLYSVFKKEKDLGKDVKFVKDKLFVNGVEYKPTD